MKKLDPRKFLRSSLLALSLASLGSFGVAQEDGHSHVAPELSVSRWLNVAPGEQPTLAALRGKTVLVELWATSVKHCGKTFPHAQALFDRYGELGLTVLAISYDTPDALEKVIELRGFSIPIGSDTTLATYTAFRVAEVPMAVLISPGGEILYHGAPEAVDLAIEAALGIEASPLALFESCLAGVHLDDDGRTNRALLERLIAKAPRAFDLHGWALGRAGEIPADFTPDLELKDPGAALDSYALSSKAADVDAANAALFGLAAGLAPRGYDLKRWARARMAKEHPLESAELDDLLATKRHELVFDAMLYRAPAEELRERALAQDAFTEYCGHALLEARTLARSGLLAQYWVFPEVEPRSRQRLWSDLGLGGMASGSDGKPQLSIGVERVDAASIGAFVDEQILRYLAGRSFASRRAPDPAAMAPRVAAERDKLLRELVTRHGGVELDKL